MKQDSKYLSISPELEKQIKNDLLPSCLAVKSNPEQMLPFVLDEARYDKMIGELLVATGDLKNGLFLEVGAGYGAMLVYAQKKYHLNVIGVEPPKEKFEGRFEIAEQLILNNDLPLDIIHKGVGEALPFDDATFDVVFSFQVLEHVADPQKVLAESWRVLKPGGILYINAPNYNTFLEGHYHVPWIPGMSKRLAKVWLKLLNHDSKYIEHINFMSARKLESYLEKIVGENIESDFGLSDWEDRMRGFQPEKYNTAITKRVVFIVQKLNLGNILVYFGKKFNWQDTLRVTLRKSI